jgi:hypothetical protein
MHAARAPPRLSPAMGHRRRGKRFTSVHSCGATVPMRAHRRGNHLKGVWSFLLGNCVRFGFRGQCAGTYLGLAEREKKAPAA